jgi:DNA-binding transcriptional LysR family regulator
MAIFDEIKQGVKEIQVLADPTAGEIRIGCGEAFGAGPLPAILERLGRLYARITYHVVLTTSPEEELQVLRERRVDMLLTRASKPFLEEDMHADVLFHERLYVIAGRQSKWARRRRAAQDIRDLRRWTGQDVGRYAGGWSFRLFSWGLLGFLRGCDSRSSGLSMPATMPVATRV